MKKFLQLVAISLSFIMTNAQAADDIKACDSFDICLAQAKQGDLASQVQLAILYNSGWMVSQDSKEAFKWFSLAAEQGNLVAQNSLGVMYFQGRGVIQDYLMAHMWFNIAASNGDLSAQDNRTSLAEMMTPEDISKAHKLAREWIAKHP